MSKKIIAYFMHEYEERLINSTIPGAQRTDSYFVGDVDENQFQLLEDKKIVMQVIESKPDNQFEKMGFKMDAIGRFRNVQDPDHQTILNEEQAAGFPSYYKFSIDGPLLESYRDSLKTENMEIIEFIAPSSYLIRMKNLNELQKLTALPFVKDAEFYSSKDTGINILSKPKSPILPEYQEKKMLTFEILLHRSEDLEEMHNWLKEKKVDVAGAAGNKIRLYLIEDSLIKEEVSQNKLVQSFEEYIPPKLHNNIARHLLGIDNFTPSINPGVTYTGDGQIVGVADTGIDDTHPDLQNQIHLQPISWGRVNDYSDFNGHGTHVTGSIVGNGACSNGQIKGTAPGAKVFFQSIMNADEELALPFQLQSLFQEAYDNGARIHSNSWGSATSSRYTVNAIEVDEFVSNNKDMLLIFSAGNDGNAFNPINAPAGFPDFLSIGSPGSAKNILTVGASRSTRAVGGYSVYTYGTIWPNIFPNPPLNSETVSGNSDSLACFSSRGPSDDSRIKPDVVAPGTDISSVKSSLAPLSHFWGIMPGNDKYAIMGGTSMSTPIVAGCAAVIREFYQKKHNHSASAALLKATIINGCRKLTGQDSVVKYPDLPNYNQGFGMVDMTKSIPDSNNNFFLEFHDNYNKPAQQFGSTGRRMRLEIKVTLNTWLRICLAYTDIPARSLQNNLNLMLDFNTDNSKWIGNENAPSILRMPDPTNNVEVIVIDNANPGTYTMQIVATNIIRGPQDFAFVISSGDLNTTINPR